MKWISVREKEPSTGTVIIVSYIIDGLKQDVVLAKKVGKNPETRELIFATSEKGTILNHRKYRVTHWMPKPDKPIMGEEKWVVIIIIKRLKK